jgi:DNA-binding GntR family transcriptional regulator
MSQATMHRLLVRPKSLTDLAHDSIRQLIVGGELAMGAQLSEATLAAQLGISKTPVREALLRLRVDGLIDIQAQRGTFVFSLTPRQVEEICAFREVVEVSAVKLAMEARRPGWWRRCRPMCARWRWPERRATGRRCASSTRRSTRRSSTTATTPI